MVWWGGGRVTVGWWGGGEAVRCSPMPVPVAGALVTADTDADADADADVNEVERLKSACKSGGFGVRLNVRKHLFILAMKKNSK